MTRTVNIIARLYFGEAVRFGVWKRLGAQIRNRIGLEESLRIMQSHAQESRSPLEQVYGHILTRLRRGQTFGDALEGLASHQEILLISSAQASGKLADGLLLAAKILQAQGVMRKSIVSNLSGPAFLLVACIGILVMMALHVIPQLALVSEPETWSGLSYLLYVMSDFIASEAGIITGIVLVCLTILTIVSLPRWTGSLRRIADKHIPWSIYRLTVGTAWLYNIAMSMAAGQQLSQILASMQKYETPYLREIVTAILQQSQKGAEFGDALHQSGMNFPSREIVDNLRFFSSFSAVKEQIHTMANEWLAQGVELVEGYAKKLSAVVNLLVIGQLAAIVLLAGSFQSQINLVGGM